MNLYSSYALIARHIRKNSILCITSGQANAANEEAHAAFQGCSYKGTSSKERVGSRSSTSESFVNSFCSKWQ